MEKYEEFVLDEVKRARTDEKFGREMPERWNEIKGRFSSRRDRLEIAAAGFAGDRRAGRNRPLLFSRRFAGGAPYLNGAYREMYLEPLEEIEAGTTERNGLTGKANGAARENESRPRQNHPQEEPTRLFSGLMLAEDTNKRFHFLSAHQRSKRLSTAFDGPTLYGIDCDADGVFGKIGEAALRSTRSKTWSALRRI